MHHDVSPCLLQIRDNRFQAIQTPKPTFLPIQTDFAGHEILIDPTTLPGTYSYCPIDARIDDLLVVDCCTISISRGNFWPFRRCPAPSSLPY